MKALFFFTFVFAVLLSSAQVAKVKMLPSDSIIYLEDFRLEKYQKGDTLNLSLFQDNEWEIKSPILGEGIIESVLFFDHSKWQEAEVQCLTGPEEIIFVNDERISLFEVGDTIKIKKIKIVGSEDFVWVVYLGTLPPGNCGGVTIKFAVIKKRWQ